MSNMELIYDVETPFLDFWFAFALLVERAILQGKNIKLTNFGEHINTSNECIYLDLQLSHQQITEIAAISSKPVLVIQQVYVPNNIANCNIICTRNKAQTLWKLTHKCSHPLFEAYGDVKTIRFMRRHLDSLQHVEWKVAQKRLARYFKSRGLAKARLPHVFSRYKIPQIWKILTWIYTSRIGERKF